MKPTANTSADRLSPAGRLVLVALGAVGIALLLMARNLEPDPRGFGTHEQLGLTPCYFQESTGHVCPTCGCTTAWAHALRAEFSQAVRTNLGGTLLCVAVVIGSPWLLLTAAWGRWSFRRPTVQFLLASSLAWLGVVVLDWLQRVWRTW